MVAVLFRLALLAAGLGTTEIGLGGALVDGSVASWAVVFLGLVLTVVGSAGFMATLIAGDGNEGRSTDG